MEICHTVHYPNMVSSALRDRTVFIGYLWENIRLSIRSINILEIIILLLFSDYKGWSKHMNICLKPVVFESLYPLGAYNLEPLVKLLEDIFVVTRPISLNGRDIWQLGLKMDRIWIEY